MKQLKLTHEEIGILCAELAHLFRAGVGAGDALALLAEDEAVSEYKTLLDAMAHKADEGEALAQIFRGSECFPSYVCSLLAVGERVGRTEETLWALARYYENRGRMLRRLKAALLYPAVLLAVMLAVVVVLLVWVLPVFNDVYAQLGSRLSGVAGGLLLLGEGLRKGLPVICLLLGLAAVFAAALAVSPGFRETVLATWRRGRGDKGLTKQINTARFAQALAMAMNSGLSPYEAVELAAGLSEGTPGFQSRCRDCLARIESGAGLASALRETGLLSGTESRLLEAGIRSGSGEAAMEQVALRLLEESETALEAATGRIEPALVTAMSVMVGLILLSVMLPLMHIMTAIG